MLKFRVIPTLLLKDVGLVKGKQFDHSRRVGTILPSVKVYNNREVDELILLDVSASISGQAPDFDTIASVTPYCLMPLTVGGGISDLEHIQKLLRLGVDKVSINSAAYKNPAFIEKAAHKFGNQCIVISIDVKKVNGRYQCFSHNGTQDESRDLLCWALEMETCGAGEILITSIDHDGMMTGYDLELIKMLTETVKIPVIASGGAGNPEHAFQAITAANASAVAAASVFHFTEQTPLSIKNYLAEKNLPVRKTNSVVTA